MNYDLDKKLTLAISSPLGSNMSSRILNKGFSFSKNSSGLLKYLLEKCLSAYQFESLSPSIKSFLNAAILTANEQQKIINDPSYRANQSQKNKEIVEKVLGGLSSEEAKNVEKFEEEFLAYAEKTISRKIKQISNKDRYPDIDFLSESEIRVIGDIGGIPLVLLGFEQGTKSPVVSKDDEKDYFATPLYELISHSQDPVNIYENLSK